MPHDLRQTRSVARRGWTSSTPVWLALALCTGFAVYRAWELNIRGSDYTGCRDCFFWPTLSNDAWLLAALALLLGIGLLLRSAGWRALARFIATLLVLAMALDTAVSVLLSQRLHLTDLLRFSGDMGSSWTVATTGLFTVAGLPRLLVAIFIIGVLATLPRAGKQHRAQAGILLALAAAWSVFAWAGGGGLQYVHQDYLRNVVQINLDNGRLLRYSASVSETATQVATSLPTVCEQVAARKPNVVFLLTESLSSYYSQLLGGPYNWTPELDALAQANHYLTRFHANSFTTSGGEIALITGLPPFYPPGKVDVAFEDFVPAAGTLADVAHRNGYKANFFTSGDIDFLNIGTWLKRIGFDLVEGSEAAFYEGMKRYSFGAAEDKVLFDRFLSWLDEGHGSGGHLSVLMTVSGHPPFSDPATGRLDEEATVRYVDAQIGRLQRELQQRRFFDDGILVIFGDHRAMTPLRSAELHEFGERAFSRIPLIVIGYVDMPKRVDEPFQQTDLLPSLRDLLGEQVCTDPFQGLLFRPEPKPPEYVVHVRGDDRDRIDVYQGAESLWAYRLAGDNSAWIDGQPAGGDRVSAWITAQRAAAARASKP